VAGRKPGVVVIHQRAFFRDCFVRCLEASYKNQDIFAFSSFAEWRNATEPAAPPPAVVVVFLDSSRASCSGDLSFLDAATGTPVVVVSDLDDASFVVNVMKHGVRGYIPTSLPLNVAVEAVRLVQAGGTFVPPCALEHDWSRRDGVTKAGELLTERQMKVAEALCQGMANKQIAYALQMSEHTVKIHLRHIMRKLNARNRTEVAILANAIFNGWTLRSAAP
jgi:DNA-binding NarL/FixJ family response regulator